MDKKITANDILGTKYKEEEKIDGNYIIDLIRDKNIEIKKEKKAFVPKTSFEKAIDNELNREKEVILKKRRENILMSEFDKKMQRLKRIKSKNYRRIRKQHLVKDKINVEKEEKIDIPEHLEEKKIIFKFEGEDEIVENESFSEDSCSDEYENDFNEEKKKIVEEEKPTVEETILPGWGNWGGNNIEIRENKYNKTESSKDGIKYSDRKDYKHGHLIINENIKDKSDKYTISLPPGYRKDEYLAKLNIPMSKERNAFQVFTKLIKKDKKENKVENGYRNNKNQI